MTSGSPPLSVVEAVAPEIGPADEQVRLAHELHDGVIQTLVGISLRLSALQRRPHIDSADLTTFLDETQRLLRGGIAELREFVLRARPALADPGALAALIADAVDRFQRDSGIRARCWCSGGPPRLSPDAAGQVLRIVQEALTNVRRHSGAANVLVSFCSGPDGIRLVVDDDGRGFPFQGSCDGRATDPARRGPAVITERVRMLGGSLKIHSTQANPGRGARLEVEVPCAGGRS